MPSLPFAGVQTIASSTAAQPVFGTKTTASANPTYDKFAGNVTGANASSTILVVSSTAGFRSGQVVLVGLSYQLGGINPNVGIVSSVSSSTSMIVWGLTQSIASGAYVILCESAESITVRSLTTNTGAIYIGNSSNVSSTDASVIDVIAVGDRFHAETTDRGHAYNTSEYWASGTANDTFVASFSQG